MKKIIVLATMLSASQSWGAPFTEEKSTLVSCNSAIKFLADYENMARASQNQHERFKILGVAHTADLNEKEIAKEKINIDIHCGKLDAFIKTAAEGDDKVYDNLMSAFDYVGGDTSKKYQRKLEMAQQRAILKAKQAEVNTVAPTK